ncbi:hypothetical protein K402DRAFT_377905 [Aulographum hederae CBS 113979]|uniref:Nucleolar protein 12 n=1 Tax=Aulographum hederae CBS 113979 TaxID=1176131 RepID=A0A6G1GZ35_9PEZI|nr:hypothetical protein K402DRAFT_377905 [Aulographum hederae CBS 113979]
MVKKAEIKGVKAEKDVTMAALPFIAKGKVLDPVLTSLFASSSGPVSAPPKSRYEGSFRRSSKAKFAEDILSDGGEGAAEEADVPMTLDSLTAPTKKRKRKEKEDQLETLYMQRLADEEKKEQSKIEAERKAKRPKNSDVEDSDEDLEEEASGDETSGSEVSSDNSDAEELDAEEEEEEEVATNGVQEQTDQPNGDEEGSDVIMEDESDGVSSPVPQHESLNTSVPTDEIEKSSRTVFLGNVSNTVISSKSDKRKLLDHLSSFIPSVPTNTPPHKIESIRFRSTAYSTKLPKKAAFAKSELMDATTKATNAYVVYTTQFAAREAAKKLNGTVILQRHLRVDSVAHPAKQDHRRCVFVGNLGFVDDDSEMQAENAADAKRKHKKREPGDVEEGLWRQFGNAGPVESVRVIRDQKTRVSKGVAYVQFKDENAVEAALLYNNKKYPPLLPRPIRVTRAKAIKRSTIRKNAAADPTRNPDSGYKRKLTGQEQSMRGRAGKLLGKAGAAKMVKGEEVSSGGREERKSDGGDGGERKGGLKGPNGAIRAPESFIFEGHRASSKQGKSGFKLGGKKTKSKSAGKPGGKPGGRAAKRSSAWKAGGGKKTS